MNETPKATAPAPAKIAAALAALESLLIAVYAILLLVASVHSSLGIASIAMLAIFFLLVAGIIGFSAVKLLQGKSFGRSMLLVWQLFFVILGVQTIWGGQLLAGILATVLGGAILILLFTKSVNNFLVGTATPRLK
ncbi:MAG: hypothetical protein Q3974_07935 [Rothia sp. (in: high G+C Gram-positive bacteria)]|nr:hypothetical protein [Rothia sp. (in: high G+C Gram-positive bacteria)]